MQCTDVVQLFDVAMKPFIFSLKLDLFKITEKSTSPRNDTLNESVDGEVASTIRPNLFHEI